MLLDWFHTGVRLESDWFQTRVRLVSDWCQTEVTWSQTGVRLVDTLGITSLVISADNGYAKVSIPISVGVFCEKFGSTYFVMF